MDKNNFPIVAQCIYRKNSKPINNHQFVVRVDKLSDYQVFAKFLPSKFPSQTPCLWL